MRKKNKLLFCILFFTAVLPACVKLFAHNLAESSNSNGPGYGVVGFEEKLGHYIPMDLHFKDETGSAVALKDLVKGPTILTIVYYRCSNACGYFETSLSRALLGYLNGGAQAPEFISISINEDETPADAQNAKRMTLESIGIPYPDEKCRFLTGGVDSIRKITDAVGFRYVKRGGEFDHPLGLIILSPEGKIVRYIIGTEILPVDLNISLMEASGGIVSPTIARVLRYCFSYDPKSHLFVFNMLRVSGTAVFLLAGAFIAYLVFSGKKNRAAGGK